MQVENVAKRLKSVDIKHLRRLWIRERCRLLTHVFSVFEDEEGGRGSWNFRHGSFNFFWTFINRLNIEIYGFLTKKWEEGVVRHR